MRKPWVTLSVVGAMLLATFVLDFWQGETFVGTPDWSRTVTDQTGLELVYVEWDEGADFVALPDSLRGDETVEIRVRNDTASIDWITGSTYVVAGVIGLLLGIVVDMSLRGFGYVRGTGQTSETPDLDVGEERGFYWRT